MDKNNNASEQFGFTTFEIISLVFMISKPVFSLLEMFFYSQNTYWRETIVLQSKGSSSTLGIKKSEIPKLLRLYCWIKLFYFLDSLEFFLI